MWVRRHFFGRNHPRGLLLLVAEWFLVVVTFSSSLFVAGARSYDPLLEQEDKQGHKTSGSVLHLKLKRVFNF